MAVADDKFLIIDRSLLFQQLRLLFEVLDKYDQLVNNLIVDRKGFKQSSFKVTVPEIGTFTCVKNKSSIDIKLDTPSRTLGLTFESLGSYFKEINFKLQKCDEEFINYHQYLKGLEDKLGNERVKDLENFSLKLEDVRVKKAENEKILERSKKRQDKLFLKIQHFRKDVLFNKRLLYFMNTFIFTMVALTVWKVLKCALPWEKFL